VTRFRRVPPPSREDIAAAKQAQECAARGHSYSDTFSLWRPEIEPGEQVQQRTPCPDCATVRVRTWSYSSVHIPPENLPESLRGRGRLPSLNMAYEAPEPGDVPGIADLAALVTEAEFAAIRAAAVRPKPPNAPNRIGDDPYETVFVPDEEPPDRLPATHIDTNLNVMAWQFYLLDAKETPASIIPVPAKAASAGIIDTVPGATVFWTGLRQGTVPLTVSIAPDDPGADLQGYQDVAEVSHRSATGRLSVAVLTHTVRTLPPLTGCGDYRLRYHVRDADAAHTSGDRADHCLLQIWPAPRARPVILQTVSQWASSRATVRPAPPRPGFPADMRAAYLRRKSTQP
jgi:hypothetical protein